jgi:integrase
MKAGKEHRVPLAPEAIALLRGLYREGDGDDGFVFLGLQPGKPLTDLALMRVLRQMGRTEVVHGFRSTFSTWAHDTAYPNVVIEQSLAHAVGSAVERAYQRSDLLERRRRLMLDWARFCSSPPAAQKAGANVVPISGGRS